jgi:ABC-type multidrug transport system, ATPase and permease components
LSAAPVLASRPWRACCCAFDPSQGRITLGGADLRDLDTATLYRHIGLSCRSALIHASVRANIALG